MIELKAIYPTGTIVKSGGGTFEVSSGKSIKIETSPGGVTYLNEVVPSGKKWTVNISIQVKVEDA